MPSRVSRPRLDREARVADRSCVASSSSARSCDHDVGAVRRAARRPGRPGRRPRRSRNAPARPASTPASASSNTTAAARLDRRASRAPARKVSGAGLPGSCLLRGDDTVDRARRRGRSSPVTREDVLACWRSRRRPRCAKPGARTARRSAPSRRTTSTPSARIWSQHQLVLAVAQAVHRLRVRRIVGRRPRAARCPATARNDRDAVGARLAVDVPVVVGGRVERAGTARPSARRASRRNSSNICFQAAACTVAVWVRTPSRSNRQARMPSRQTK